MPRLSPGAALWAALLFGCAASAPLAAANAMNPDLSASGLFLYRRDSSPTAATPAQGFQVQELEAQIASDIDPYLRGVMILTAAPDGTGGWDLAPEEAYVESLSLPAWTLKAGRFRAALGRSNPTHTHALPFIDAPLANESLLGDGIDESGVAAAWLLPLPWFVELTGQAFSAPQSTFFGSAGMDELAGLASLKSLWDLDEASTVELQLSWMEGRDAVQDLSQLANASLTYKRKDARGRGLSLAGEYLRTELPPSARAPLDDRAGLSGWLQWQFSQRCWIQARAEALAARADLGLPAVRKYSALFALVPTEFSALRLQYDWIEAQVAAPVHRVTAQLNFTMGVHPAHAY